MDQEAYRKKIEAEVLKILAEKLKTGEMTEDRARDIAQFVLKHLHPHMNLDQIYQVVQNFDDHFPELTKAVLPAVKEYEDTVSQIVKAHAERLMAQGKFQEASSLMQKTIKKQVKLGK
jgi:uncharacterized protein with PhoU and TrkA domain